MTREEEIKEAMDKICEFKAYPFNRGFIAGVQWADEHSKNPGWRSCLKRMPKLGEKVLFEGYDNTQVVTPVVLSVIEKTIKEREDRFYFLVEENELSNS